MKMSLPKFVFACRVHNSIDHRHTHTHTREKERQQKSGISVTHTAHLRNIFYFSQVHCAQTWFAFVHFSFAENLWLSFFPNRQIRVQPSTIIGWTNHILCRCILYVLHKPYSYKKKSAWGNCMTLQCNQVYFRLDRTHQTAAQWNFHIKIANISQINTNQSQFSYCKRILIRNKCASHAIHQ